MSTYVQGGNKLSVNGYRKLSHFYFSFRTKTHVLLQEPGKFEIDYLNGDMYSSLFSITTSWKTT